MGMVSVVRWSAVRRPPARGAPRPLVLRLEPAASVWKSSRVTELEVPSSVLVPVPSVPTHTTLPMSMAMTMAMAMAMAMPTPPQLLPSPQPPTLATTTARPIRPTTRRPSPCTAPPTTIGSAPSSVSSGSRWSASLPTSATSTSVGRPVGRSIPPPWARWASAASTAPTPPSRPGPRDPSCIPSPSRPSTWPCATSSGTTFWPVRPCPSTSSSATPPSGTRPSSPRRIRTSTWPRAARTWASWRRAGCCSWGRRRT
mmetsp:Transcript_5743/g.13790  ORF Transcript_5743/g.13790 Transcript_5743/m.13790 type:complete len:256 (+) Transcript_5743:244-1011(+)